MKQRRGLVEAAPVRELVDRIVREEFGEDVGTWLAEPLVSSVCVKAGIRPDTLYHVWAKEKEYMDFDVADRLLSALGAADLWMYELSEVYAAVDLSGPPLSDPYVFPPVEEAVCPNCETAFTYQPWRTNRPQRMYCSPGCRQSHRGKLGGRERGKRMRKAYLEGIPHAA